VAVLKSASDLERVGDEAKQDRQGWRISLATAAGQPSNRNSA
jgi:hypothetical protein